MFQTQKNEETYFVKIYDSNFFWLKIFVEPPGFAVAVNATTFDLDDDASNCKQPLLK